MTMRPTTRIRRLGMIAGIGVCILAGGRADASPELVNLPATNVSDTTTWLNGSLLATGTVPYAVWVYWDTHDAMTNTSWPNRHEFGEHLVADLTWQATGLTPNTDYYYTYYASNATGELWAQPSESFQTWGPPSVDNAGGATNIGVRRAKLTGRLLDGIGAYATVYWWSGPSPASNSLSAGWVSEGQSFSVPVTGLQDETVYAYRCFVSNGYGTAWSEPTGFRTPFFDGHYYVATNGAADGDGSSWAQALTNLQTALDQARPGETIHLAAHTFRNSTPRLTSQYVWTNKPLTILGGYAAEGGLPGALTNVPTILTRPSGTNRILYISGVTNGTLQRVTLAGGSLYRTPGAGLYVAACSNLSIGTCVISNNYNSTDNNPGGTKAAGAYLTGSDVLLTNCVVILNRAYGSGKNYATCWGGGVYVAGGRVRLEGTLVSGNWADGHAGCRGGGLYLESGTLVVSNSFVVNNKCRNTSDLSKTNGYGGALYTAGGTLTLVNALVSSNQAAGTNGDGIYAGGGGASFINCTVVSNYAIGFRYAAGAVAMTNCIVWGHTAADVAGFPSDSGVLQNVAYSLLGGPPEMNGVNGCIVDDPRFVAPATNNFSLRRSSPAVNRGLTLPGQISGVDLAGNHRVAAGVVDMGAYELPQRGAVIIVW
jgi:hypothetical protein